MTDRMKEETMAYEHPLRIPSGYDALTVGEGWNAYIAGKDASDCPYSQDDPRYGFWRYGWMECADYDQ